MGAARPQEWDDLERREVDLGAVLGTPGLAHPEELAEQLRGASDGPWDQAAPGDGLFLCGRPGALPSAPLPLVGAFGPTAAPVLDRLNAGTPRSETPFRADDVMLTRHSASGPHVVAHQRVRGAEVVGARYQVHTDGLGNVAVTGRPVGDLARRDPGPPPPVPLEEGAAAIRAIFSVPPLAAVDVERVVFPVGDAAVWAFAGRFLLDHPPCDVRAFVRADDGSLLLSYNVACSALFGEAEVYPVNPKRTPEPKVVRLERLGPHPADRLTGTVVDVRPERGDPFANPQRNARLRPGEPGFEEASAYYHLWAATRWCAGVLGTDLFAAVPFAPLRAVVNDESAAGQAYYLPSEGKILFGGGDKPTSRSADFVFHEFGHAVADAVCRLSRSIGRQALGLSEGVGDYVAASALDNPRFGEWLADEGSEALRDCSDPGLAFSPNFVGEQHATGAVWAAVLWGVRDRLGPEVADLLVLDSLQYLEKEATFAEAHAALLRSDHALFPDQQSATGRHEAVLSEEFDKRRPAP